ncbi:hypothetical protein CHS0354_009588 [Potamilus streckersoni]|nr:hypothetical protein CHS0354_009588 [Potamilus streckersoni]
MTAFPSSISEHQMVCTRSPRTQSDNIMKRHKYASSQSLHIGEIPSDPQSPIKGDNFCDSVFGEYLPQSISESDSVVSTDGDMTHKGNLSYSSSFPDPNFESLDKLDIIGESSETRFPWQRDVSTQCDMPMFSHRSSISSRSSRTSFDSDDSQDGAYVPSPPKADVLKRQRMFRHSRPHSVGCMENTIYEEEVQQMREQSRRARKSDPFLHSTFTYNRKRVPYFAPEDSGSATDLEAITEYPSREGTTEASRNNSLVTEEEHNNVQDEMQQLLVNGTQKGLAYLDVLPSPRMSPDFWKGIPDVIVNSDSEDSPDLLNGRKNIHQGSTNLLTVPNKTHRRRSSGSLTSGSEESDVEPDPPVARRGRRAAIVDTKNFGDVSPTTLSPDISPSNSCDEGEGASNIAGRLRRRRSSVELAMSIYPGDLLVQEHHKKLIKRNTISDFYAARNGSTPSLNEDKKSRQSFSFKKLMKTRSKESLTHLGDVLAKLKPSEFKDNHLAGYKLLHWSDLIACSDKQPPNGKLLDIPEKERKRREAVWELFKSELVYLIDHLMVIKHCFMEPLKKVQVEGFLMYAEPPDIFSNLDELCYVSYTFCKDFISALVKDMTFGNFGRTSVLIKAFQRFSSHSKDGAVFHSYCLNYSNALNYLEQLRKSDDFCEFEKWCEQDSRCNRLQLNDLLISPMQHCTKLPLLLNNVMKYTIDEDEKEQLAESLEKVEASLQQLEDKMKWVKNFERVQEIQRQLVWPSVTELDARVFIPEFLKSTLLKQPCERLLACPKRQLIHEGQLSMVESTKTSDVYLFLFDDILLITKMKKPNRKKQSVNDINHVKTTSTGQGDKACYIVHRQPIALDRFGLHDINAAEAAANGVKNAFVLVQFSRFQQIIGVYTLQAPNEMTKAIWVSQIKDAKAKYNEDNINHQNPIKDVKHEVAERATSMETASFKTSPTRKRSSSARPKLEHGKSLSMDAVYL